MKSTISKFSKLKSLMLVLVFALSFVFAGTVLLNINTQKVLHNVDEIESVGAVSFNFNYYNKVQAGSNGSLVVSLRYNDAGTYAYQDSSMSYVQMGGCENDQGSSIEESGNKLYITVKNVYEVDLGGGETTDGYTNDTYTIVATPISDSFVFDKWEQTDDKTITAKFKESSVTIYFEAAEGGTVSDSSCDVPSTSEIITSGLRVYRDSISDSNILCRAYENTGYDFDYWDTSFNDGKITYTAYFVSMDVKIHVFKDAPQTDFFYTNYKYKISGTFYLSRYKTTNTQSYSVTIDNESFGEIKAVGIGEWYIWAPIKPNSSVTNYAATGYYIDVYYGDTSFWGGAYYYTISRNEGVGTQLITKVGTTSANAQNGEEFTDEETPILYGSSVYASATALSGYGSLSLNYGSIPVDSTGYTFTVALTNDAISSTAESISNTVIISIVDGSNNNPYSISGTAYLRLVNDNESTNLSAQFNSENSKTIDDVTNGEYCVWMPIISGGETILTNKTVTVENNSPIVYITYYTISHAQGDNTTLTTKYGGSSGTSFTSDTLIVQGATVYAEATASSGYHITSFAHDHIITQMNTNGDTFTVETNETVMSSATANTVTINTQNSSGSALSISGTAYLRASGNTTSTTYSATFSSSSSETISAVPTGTYCVWLPIVSGGTTVLTSATVTVDSSNYTPSVNVKYYTISRSQEANTTLTTKPGGSSGTSFTSDTAIVEGATVYAEATAPAGYHVSSLTHGSTAMTASGDTFIVSSNETVSSSAEANMVTINIKKDNESTPYPVTGAIFLSLSNKDVGNRYVYLSNESTASFSVVPNEKYFIYAQRQNEGNTYFVCGDVTVENNSPIVNIFYYTVTFSEGDGTTLIVYHDRGLNEPFLQNSGVTIEATANDGYHGVILKHGLTEVTASGYALIITQSETISSSAEANEVTFYVRKNGTSTLYPISGTIYLSKSNTDRMASGYKSAVISNSYSGSFSPVENGEYYVWAPIVSESTESICYGSVSVNDNSPDTVVIDYCTISRSQGDNTTLKTKYGGSDGTVFPSDHVTLVQGAKVYAEATASGTGYHAELTHGSTVMTASGDTFIVTQAETITSTAILNTLTFEDKIIYKVYSTSSQTFSVTTASNGSGTYTYALTAIDGFSLIGTTVTISESKGVGAYSLTITASDTITGTTKSATYTVNIAQRTVSVTTLPSAVGSTLTYNGSAQTLMTAGECDEGGTIYYKVTISSLAPSWNNGSGWETVVTGTNAKGTNAGTYYLWYYCYVSDTENNTGTGINTVTKLDGTKEISRQKVNSVTNLSVTTAGVVTWYASTNATGYEISLDNSNWESATSGETNYLTQLTQTAEDKTIYVRAINSDTTNYETSENATKTVNICSVTLEKDTGISAVSGAGNYISGATVSIDATVSAGYTWSKWVQTTGGADVSTAKAYSAAISDNWTYTATATMINDYKLTISLNGGTYNNGNYEQTEIYDVTLDKIEISLLEGDTYTLKDILKTGYTFNNWTCEPSDALENGIITMGEGNITLTANWVAISYQVEFNKNATDATGEMSNQSFNYDETKNLTINTYNRDGYNFLGWSRNVNALEAEFNDEQEVSNLTEENNATVILYAIWNNIQIAVTYNALDGSIVQQQVKTSYNYGEEIIVDKTLVTAQKDGWEFVGWRVESSADITTPTSSVSAGTENITLVAIYKKSVKLSFNSNTGTGEIPDLNSDMFFTVTTENENYIKEAEFDIPSCSFTKPYYIFMGWTLNSNQGTVIQTSKISLREDSTLYASWKHLTLEEIATISIVLSTEQGESLVSEAEYGSNLKIKIENVDTSNTLQKLIENGEVTVQWQYITHLVQGNYIDIDKANSLMFNVSGDIYANRHIRVAVTPAENSDFNPKTPLYTSIISITKKQLTYSSNPVVQNKVYNPTNLDATIIKNAEVNGLVASDNVKLKLISAKFENSTIGTNKQVTIKYKLDDNNDLSKNYELPQDEIIVTANIIKPTASLTVSLITEDINKENLKLNLLFISSSGRRYVASLSIEQSITFKEVDEYGKGKLYYSISNEATITVKEADNFVYKEMVEVDLGSQIPNQIFKISASLNKNKTSYKITLNGQIVKEVNLTNNTFDIYLIFDMLIVGITVLVTLLNIKKRRNLNV